MALNHGAGPTPSRSVTWARSLSQSNRSRVRWRSWTRGRAMEPDVERKRGERDLASLEFRRPVGPSGRGQIAPSGGHGAGVGGWARRGPRGAAHEPPPQRRRGTLGGAAWGCRQAPSEVPVRFQEALPPRRALCGALRILSAGVARSDDTQGGVPMRRAPTPPVLPTPTRRPPGSPAGAFGPLSPPQCPGSLPDR